MAWARQAAKPSRCPPSLPPHQPQPPIAMCPKTKLALLEVSPPPPPHLHSGEQVCEQARTGHGQGAKCLLVNWSKECSRKALKKLHLESRTSHSLRHTISYFPFSFLAFKAGQRKKSTPVVSGAIGLWDISLEKHHLCRTAWLCSLQLFLRSRNIKFPSTEYSGLK